MSVLAVVQADTEKSVSSTFNTIQPHILAAKGLKLFYLDLNIFVDLQFRGSAEFAFYHQSFLYCILITAEKCADSMVVLCSLLNREQDHGPILVKFLNLM